MGAKKRKAVIEQVIGIDPSLERTAVCWWDKGEEPYVSSNKGMDWTGLVRVDNSKIYIETPQNGQHSSRRGVAIATGAILHAFDVTPEQYKKDVVFVKPDVWRKHVFGRAIRDGQAKEHALALCAERWPGLNIRVHDEAESVLIACYGWWAETGERVI